MQPGKHSQLLSHCPKLVWLPAVSSAVPASHGFQPARSHTAGPLLTSAVNPSISVLNQTTPTTSPSRGDLGFRQHSPCWEAGLSMSIETKSIFQQLP